jgi:type II secretory pathway predicted ATPase ExeA
MQIAQHLSDNLIEQGKTPVVIVDECHLLDDSTLEDLRLLTNADFDRLSPLALILLGQLPIRARLKAPGLEAICQRLRFRYALEGFSEEETAAYIKHHLRLVGLNEDLFTKEAVKQIFLASAGLPREINNYCTMAVLKAQSASLSSIDAKLIRQVLDQRELN